MALNFDPARIDAELGALNLATLLDGIDADKLVEALAAVKATFAKGTATKNEIASLVLNVTKSLGNFSNKVTASYYLYSHKEELWNKFKGFTGLCSGDAFLKWFDDLLKRKLRDDKVHLKYKEDFVENFTLENLAILVNDPDFNYKHLYVVTTCITGEPRSIVISSEVEKGKQYEAFKKCKVSHVVRASMSIPAIFKPFPLTYIENGKEYTIECLDGGMLQNFPIKLFDKAKYLSRYLKGDGEYEVFNEETLGFRLVDDVAQFTPEKFEKINDALTFVSQIMNLFYNAEANFANLENAYQYRCIAISNCGVGTLDFNVTDTKKEEMKKKGYDTVNAFFEGYEQLAPSQSQPGASGLSALGTFAVPKQSSSSLNHPTTINPKNTSGPPIKKY